MTDIRSTREYARDLLAQYAPQDHFDLRVDQCAIRVHSNSHDLLARLRQYYRAFLTQSAQPDITVTIIESPVLHPDVVFQAVPPASGKTRIKDEFLDFPDGRMLRNA